MKFTTKPTTFIISEQHIRNITEWVEALESGQYHQGITYLTRIGEKFDCDCCLGVACKLNQLPSNEEHRGNGTLVRQYKFSGDNIDEMESVLPKTWWFADIYGFDPREMWMGSADEHKPWMVHEGKEYDLPTLNDRTDMGFEGIAKVIRSVFLDKKVIEIECNYRFD